jgi:transcription elongation factor GreA
MRSSRKKADESEENYKPFHLTADGLARLKEKLSRLKERLPALAEETRRTAAYGDRSENAEYKEAKSSLRRANWQVLQLEDQIKRAEVINSTPNTSGLVGLGSTVVLGGKGKEKTFEILGSHETDPAHGRISYESPLGAALMRRRKGDIVMVQTAKGPVEYKIIEIR